MRKTINPGTSFRGAGSVGSMRGMLSAPRRPQPVAAEPMPAGPEYNPGRLEGLTPPPPSAWANIKQQAPKAGAVVTPAVPVAEAAPAPVAADRRNGRTVEEIASSWGP